MTNRSLYELVGLQLFAGGGKVKGLTRRDILRGLGAVGVAGAAAGKAGRHVGADVLPELKRIEEAVTSPAVAKAGVRSVMKGSDAFHWMVENLRTHAEDIRADAKAQMAREGVTSPSELSKAHQDLSEFWEDADMFLDDADEYDAIARAIDEGDLGRAAQRYDNLDTSAREYIYEFLEQDDLDSARRILMESGSDWESEIPVRQHPEWKSLEKRLKKAQLKGEKTGDYTKRDEILEILEYDDYDIKEAMEGIPSEPKKLVNHPEYRKIQEELDELGQVFDEQRRGSQKYRKAANRFQDMMNDIEDAGFDPDELEELLDEY